MKSLVTLVGGSGLYFGELSFLLLESVLLALALLWLLPESLRGQE